MLKTPSSRLVRWRLTLEEYDYEIHYREAKKNQNADTLSRINVNDTNSKILTINNSIYTYSKFLNETKTKIFNYDKIFEHNDSLSSCSNYIGICISEDLEFSDKIQKDIKSKFNHTSKLAPQNLKTHDVALIRENNIVTFYLIKKEHYWEKTTCETLFDLLCKLKQKLISENLNMINLPRLGSGFDKLKWTKIRFMLRYIFRDSNININIYHDVLIQPDKSQINGILIENHNNPSSGHSGFHRTYGRIKQTYRWFNMKNDIKNFIKHCIDCQKNKLVRKKDKHPTEITTTSSHPFERLALNIVGPLPLTEFGNKYILTQQDDLTKYTQAYAIRNHESLTIAKSFIHKFICQFSLPKSILTDQGSDFMSKLFSDVAKLFEIKKLNCTAYHPETDGALERVHSTLKDYLKHYIDTNESDWNQWLDFACFSYNNTVHSSTKFTPFELVFGIKPTIRSDFNKNPEFRYTFDDYLDELTLKLCKSRQLAKEHLIKSKHINKNIMIKRVR